MLAARRTAGEYRPFVWTFSARFEDLTLEGEITAPASDVIGLNYTDTNGKTKYCYNSAIATCRIRLSGTDSVELTATQRTMFEILTDARHPDVALLA